MSDVFSALLSDSRGYLRDAAAAAARELGLFDALPARTDALDAILGVRSHRLRALVRALVREGVLVESDGLLRCGSVPTTRPLPPGGWGRIAHAIRADRPIPSAGIDGRGGAELRRFHEHLRDAGGEAAREVVELLGPAGPLLDLGGGAGGYAAAFLAAHPGERAIVVDRTDVLELARASVPQADLVALDLLGPAPWPQGARVALLANVLHLFSAIDAARLVVRAARSVAPGGTVAVKDFDAASEAGTLFSLNMALYTESGEVHDTAALLRFFHDAGLGDVEVLRLRCGPDSLLVRGTVPLDVDRAAVADVSRAGSS